MNLIKPECLAKYEAWAKTVFRNSAVITNSVGKGFRSVKKDILDSIDFSKLNKDSWVIVPNDFDLTMTKEFYVRGITHLVFLTTDMSDEQAVNNYFFNIVYNSPRFKSLLVEDKLPWKAIVRLTKKVTPKLNKKGEVTDKFIEELTLEGDTEYMPKKFGAITANFPFSMGNDITTFIVNEIDFDDEGFVNVLPISKYKKGNLTQHIVLGSIKNNKRGRETSDFDGADTYPVICKLSRTKTNDLSFADFERLWCVNREEGFGKKFFEEQDRRIAAEEAGTRKKAFVEQIYMVYKRDLHKIDNTTAFTSSIWTPNIAHGWGAQEINDPKTGKLKDNDYCTWNLTNASTAYTEVFKPTAMDNVNQTVTIFNTSAGKSNFVKWWHSAEMSGKYRHCGLSTILLRWMNKTTGCKYDYIIPRVDWDSRTWTDEEILKDYGYTNEETENILHYNDDLIPDSWTSKLSKKD
jgi:hypothetical protein